MEMKAGQNDFANWICEALQVSVGETESSYNYDLEKLGVKRILLLEKDNLASIIASLASMTEVAETVISDPTCYETLVREESTFPRVRFLLRDDALKIEDGDNAIKYSLSAPSDVYLMFLLYKISEIASPRALLGPMPIKRIIERRGEEDIDNVFDLLRRCLHRFLTLRLESSKNRLPSEFEKFSWAFLFQLSFNSGVALVPQRHLEELIRTSRIIHGRRESLDKVDPPRRHYIPDLIYHYQLAIGTDSPFLEYISYYHVSEHFFESVFNEDLILRIKNKITLPDFSYKRKKDIGVLIKDISKSLQIRNERITFSEQEALRLTIEKYINLEELKQKLYEYDESLIYYYQQTKVNFSGGDEVNLNVNDAKEVINRLSARIYKTRNAIVHSKESERVRYIPFRDDRVLVKEIPLLRFIAEQIIIKSSVIVS